MIDIVGFSSWCNNVSPQRITKSMIRYNNIISDVLEKYHSLMKIELVGDCCMVVGGMNSSSLDNNYIQPMSIHVHQCVMFAFELINELTSTNILDPYYIRGVRVGIHLGDTFGTFIERPRKFQLFGNDINLASRLESSAYPNTVHISEKHLQTVVQTIST